jgi:hypothetical protein
MSEENEVGFISGCAQAVGDVAKFGVSLAASISRKEKLKHPEAFKRGYASILSQAASDSEKESFWDWLRR